MDDREARDYGIDGPSGTLGGILYAFLGPDGQERSYRLRRDVVPDAGGKYVNSADRSAWAFPPGAQDRCSGSNAVVIFVESVTSMLMLEALNKSEMAPPLLPVALGGAYSWRGRIGKRTDANGARGDERGPLRDFQAITWPDRDVVILFDSNTDDERNQEKAKKLRRNRDKLAAYLTDLGAKVRIGIVPVEDGVNGPDDYRAQHDDDAVQALLDRAKPWTPSTQGDGSDEDDEKARPSQATRLVELAEEAGATFFASPDGDHFMAVPVNGHVETFAVPSRQCRDFLTRTYFGTSRRVPSAQGLADAVAAIGARAAFDGQQAPVFVRVAEQHGAIYLDLGDPSWRAVEITPNGWRLVDIPPVRFRRPKGQRPLPEPKRGELGIGLLRQFVNVASDQDFILVVSYLVACLRPQGPYPALSLTGEAGSAKSTTARVIKRTLDPSAAPLRSEPKEPRDLMIGAHNGHVIAFDNISHLSVWLSDGFCRLATGGGFTTRALYSDTDETILDIQRPVILTGIDDYITRGDLLDRALIVQLPRIGDEQRVTELEFWQAFDEAHPEILGALLDAVVAALKHYPTVSLPNLPRMADFALWSAAAAPAHGWTPEDFVNAYTKARNAAIEGTLDTEPFAQAVLAVEVPWDGTATELLAVLNDKASESTRKGKTWPLSPKSVSMNLRRLAPMLRATGLDIAFDRTGRHRQIHLRRPEEEGAPASPASLPSQRQNPPQIHAVPRDGGRDDDDLCEDRLWPTVTSVPQQSGGNDDGDGGDGHAPPPSAWPKVGTYDL